MYNSVIETERLFLRELSAEEDAAFILELVNEPAWIRNIGDRGIRTIDAAREYILNGMVKDTSKTFRSVSRRFEGFGRSVGIAV